MGEMVNIYVIITFLLLILVVLMKNTLDREMKIRFLLKKEVDSYKNLIFNISEAMHNIGNFPLKNENDIKPFVSVENLRKLQTLFRISRRICREDIESKLDLLNELSKTLDHIIEQNIEISFEQMEDIEREALHTHYGVVLTKLKALNNTKPNLLNVFSK